MLRACAATGLVFASAIAGQAAGLCGSPDDSSFMYAMTAIIAAERCQDVATISDITLGTLMISASVDARIAACDGEVRQAARAERARADQDRVAWCSNARVKLAGHPLTAGLVGRAPSAPDSLPVLAGAEKPQIVQIQSGEPVPNFDPVAICKKQAAAIGQGDWLVQACLDQEQTAYDALKAQWPTIDARIKGLCIKQARAIGQGYWLLQACVDQEVEAKQAVQQFKFKR